MTDKDFEIDIEAKIIARKSPDFEDVKFKATAASEKDLIERHTIGKFDEQEPDEDEQEESKSDL